MIPQVCVDRVAKGICVQIGLGGEEVKKRRVFHMGNEGGLVKSKKHQTKSVVNNKK